MKKELKLSNPKDAVGSKKIPFHLLSWPVIAEMAIGMLEGALKYGAHNYRAIGVRTTVYLDACDRHLKAFAEGEDIDAESKLSHITKALDCLMVLRDAQIQGKCNDDRPPKTSGNWVQKYNNMAKDMIESCNDPVEPYLETNRKEWDNGQK